MKEAARMESIKRTAEILVTGFFSLGFLSLAGITLLPAEASKVNHLDYYGVCSFAPNSTLALIAMAAASLFIGLKIRGHDTQSGMKI
jgi:hypothetical protein